MSDEVLPSVLLVGCGRMGGAMFRGWHAAGLAPSVVLAPSRKDVPPPHQWTADLDGVPDGFAPEFVVASVKPAVAAVALPVVCRRFPQATLLSVMAGRRIDWLSRKTGTDRVIRAMPNTPSAIGQGISGVWASNAVGDRERRNAERLLRASGDVVWLDSEDQIDAVIAVSGSGPAYVFLLAELMAETGVGLGLSDVVANRLARATISGAGRLLEVDGRPPEALRDEVTSKGGTTAAALLVLRADDAWPALLRRALGAAAERSRELAAAD